MPTSFEVSDWILKVESLGKRYRIRHHEPRERYTALRDVLANKVKRLFRNSKFEIRNPKSSEDFWALRDVSFEVKQGEVVGIIGRNGAGKSTLLKILSRITEPTAGRVRLRGRVASLLEVGTGFHPELTGRENIFLNGAILGMTRGEIRRKFDEIVAFAEVEKFLDTPVKHYSSGMYMRLAFAVAAHLEPEILIIDEVLAVGDEVFQKKCLGKMQDVAGREGRTVLFVSHNMGTVLSLCHTAILLDRGSVLMREATQKVVRAYFQMVANAERLDLKHRRDRAGEGFARMVRLKIQSLDPDEVIRSTSRLKVTIGFQGDRPIQNPRFLVGIYDYTNAGLFLLNSEAFGGLPKCLPQSGEVSCITDPVNLTPGQCYLNLALYSGSEMGDYVQYAGSFNVEVDDVYPLGKTPPREWVMCVVKQQWLTNGK